MPRIDSGIRFPGESEEYRLERNRLLEAEAEPSPSVAPGAARPLAAPL